MDSLEISPEIRRRRDHWVYRGETRPPFAHEPGPGQESVWDYPRPPRLEPDPRHIRVVFDNRLLAESRNSLRILETAGPPTFYLPRHDVLMDRLRRSETSLLCEWKGRSTGFDLVDGTREVAWSYLETFIEFEAIRGYFAFYPARVECFVDEERVVTQPGGYYGGWITREIVGPFKGDPECEDL